MVERRPYVITRQYGRTIEGIQNAEAAYHDALRRRDYTEAAACMKDRDDWIDLAKITPRFTYELPGVARG
ncbi:hypothetical protein [Luteimonas fraxinea]|uniref:hypothetical protein n=1 Tax=Luteimonas fraxinea TaxID=2901869 RepID=UPI001E4C87DD|nr:hypothetical protein [Luteimonas fraxinea]MCD9125865.1 hypothetical protein [Luteimonas fraxinea]